jgi:hypothetical protein
MANKKKGAVMGMPTSNIDLKRSIESQYGGTATLIQSVPVPVRETFGGQTVWDGVVSIFNLKGHPTAKRAYAWSCELPDGKRRFFAVLQTNRITSPTEAVRAAIIADQPQTKT